MGLLPSLWAKSENIYYFIWKVISSRVISSKMIRFFSPICSSTNPSGYPFTHTWGLSLKFYPTAVDTLDKDRWLSNKMLVNVGRPLPLTEHQAGTNLNMWVNWLPSSLNSFMAAKSREHCLSFNMYILMSLFVLVIPFCEIPSQMVLE